MALDIESRVLSSLMMIGEPKNIKSQQAMLALSSECFFNFESRELFCLINQQFNMGHPFDAYRMSSLVPISIFEYTNQVIPLSWSLSNFDDDIDFLVDSLRARRIRMRLDQTLKAFSQQGNPAVACSIAIDGCMEINSMALINEDHTYTNEKCAEYYLSNFHKTERVIPTGIESLDQVNDGGFKENGLITIAGRSGMGKTGFGVFLAHHLAKNHPAQHVLFYSLEMSFSDIYEKRLSAIIGKHPSVANKIERDKAIAQAFDTPFTIVTKPLATIDFIETNSRITHIKQPISVIVVDYLGIVQNNNKLESHVLRQADISLRLAALAAELNCIVIALTQVNRDYANREDKVPITSDAADSSGSERSSSYWLGIYRPEVDNEYENKNEFIVKCRKNRFGNPWTVTFAFNNATFAEIDQTKQYKPMPQKKGMAAYMKQR